MWTTFVRTAVRLFSPKWTVGALALLTNEKGEVLIAKHRGRSHPWGFPGGMLAPPETPLQGLCRELSEELGLELSQLHFTVQSPLTSTKFPMIELIFSYNIPLKYSQISAIKIQQMEIRELRWVSLESLAAQEGMLDRHRSALEGFLRSGAASPKETRANLEP